MGGQIVAQAVSFLVRRRLGLDTWALSWRYFGQLSQGMMGQVNAALLRYQRESTERWS